VRSKASGIGTQSPVNPDSAFTWYIRGADGKELAEYDPLASAYIQKFIYAGDRRIAFVAANGTVYYYVQDHLGSVRALVQDNGSRRNQNYYWAFGEDAGGEVHKSHQSDAARDIRL
jgi:hypothetical protein